jgi:hypothetical protein
MRVRVLKIHKSKYAKQENMIGKIPEDEIDLRGHEKRGVCSFQCSESLWRKFDKIVEKHYGKYKKSKIIEEMLRRFVDKEEKKII